MYVKSTVSTKCCQFSLLANIYEISISAGIETSSVNKTLLIVSLLNIFNLPSYFQPASSKILTAWALYSPKVFIEILSSL